MSELGMSFARQKPIKDLLVIVAMNLAASVRSLLVLALATALAWYFELWVQLLLVVAGMAVGLMVGRALAGNHGTFLIAPDQEPALTEHIAG